MIEKQISDEHVNLEVRLFRELNGMFREQKSRLDPQSRSETAEADTPPGSRASRKPEIRLTFTSLLLRNTISLRRHFYLRRCECVKIHPTY